MAKFEAELIEGHGGVTVVIVPFDPQDAWQKEPVMLDDRRFGWLVRGKIEKVPFFGWIGHRWKRFFIIVEPSLCKKARIEIGDTVSVTVQPTESEKAMAKALEQAPLTTAPGRKRKRKA